MQYQDNCGRTTTVSVDVTQGSILGPLFLVVNLNNLFYLDYFTAVWNFAHDTTFACEEDLESLINRLELDSFLKLDSFLELDSFLATELFQNNYQWNWTKTSVINLLLDTSTKLSRKKLVEKKSRNL